MARQVVVRADHVLTASFALDAGDAGPVIERVGAARTTAPEPVGDDESILAGIRAACGQRNAAAPESLRVRLATHAADAPDALVTAILAGVAGVSLLLNLGLSDDELVASCVAAGAPREAAEIVLRGAESPTGRGFRVALRPTCDEPERPSVDSARMAARP